MKSQSLHALIVTLLCVAFTPKVRAQLPDAWQIDDNSSTSYAGYTNILDINLVTGALHYYGFDFKINARFVTDYGLGNQTMAMVYGDDRTRWEVLWSLNSNNDLISELVTNLSPLSGESFVVTTNGTGRSLYHTHEMIYNPTNRQVSYLVDGQVLATNWGGTSLSGWPVGQVFWGATVSGGMGQMNFHSVTFTITNGDVAAYDAGTEPASAASPESQGWSLSPPNPPPGTGTNAISPDTAPLPADAVATTLGAGSTEPYQETLSGAVNPSGLAAAAWFEWGTDTNYGNVTAPRLLLADTNAMNLSQTIIGLAKGAAYHFRCVATNTLGVAYGQDAVFTTPSEFTVTTLADGGHGSLRQCISAAQSGDTISFATNGIITLTNDELLITNDLAIVNPGPANLILDGGGNSRVLEIAASNVVTLDSLTLTNGFADLGGGILLNSNASLAMNHCILTGNSAGYGGGGIYSYSGTSLTFSNCFFTGNSATTSEGGGICDNGGNSLTLNHCLFSGNFAEDGGGVLNGATLMVSSSTFSGNSATTFDGGGIENFGMSTINNSTFSGNLTGFSGGGIYNEGTLTLNYCTLSDNSANTDGGGFCEINGTATLNNSTLSGNSANQGGGIYEDALVILYNSTVSGNSATNSGGGIYDYGYYATNLVLTNSIVAGNIAPSDGNIVGLYSGVNNLTTGLPLLASLGNYGGPTQTMPPLASSPAIDAGDDSVTSFLTTDQRGYPRKSGAHVDIGAVEAQVASAGNPPVLKNPVWSFAGGGDRSFHFSFTNSPEIDFTALTSTNLALLLTNWTVLGNAIQTTPGTYQFTDPAATNAPQRFYRVVSP